MTLEKILAKTNLPKKYQTKLKSFVKNVHKNSDYFRGILLFGSAAKGNFDKYSDIDLIVFTNNLGFNTDYKIYDVIADNYFEPLIVQVKSANELSGKNQISMDIGFMEHLQNVGVVLSNKWNTLDFSSALNSPDFGKYAPSLWYSIYRVRQDLLLSKYVENGFSEAQKHIHPTSPAHFFNQAVRRTLKLPLTPKQDNWIDIINLFYKTVHLPTRIAEISDLRKKNRKNAMVYGDYVQCKDIVEEASWALNNYLNKSKSF